jgi:hypothetical protein
MHGMHLGRLEVLSVMHQPLRRLRWRSIPGTSMPLDITALATPSDGLPIRLVRRRRHRPPVASVHVAGAR